MFDVRELNKAIELWGVVFCAVGIASTRARLAAMREGTLELDSEPGAGAVATVRIPKRKDVEGGDAR